MNRYTARLVINQKVVQSSSNDDIDRLTAWAAGLVDESYCNALCVIVDNQTQKIIQHLKKAASE